MPQTVALSGVGCISLIEFVKNFRTGCLIHTLSTIFNDKHHVAAGAVYMNICVEISLRHSVNR